MEKSRDTPEKTSPTWENFHKNMPKLPLAINWNSKSAIKFEIKAICKTELCRKQAQKNRQISIKQATRKSSKNLQLHKKNKPKFTGKPQGRFATLLAQQMPQKYCNTFFYYCVTIMI